MRLGEILALEWPHVHEKWVDVVDSKNGEARSVPLSSTAKRILALMPRRGQRVFRPDSATFDAMWRKVRPEGLHFHDTRATALTRLSKIFQPIELARIAGHKSMDMVLRVYYRPTAAELADRLD